MSLTVKVIFERVSGSKEIRRFPVDTGGADLFNATKEKIRQLYPALAHGSFTLYWQDPDGDRVAFSSSEEMKEAMAYAPDNVLRVYVSEPKESAEKSDQDQRQQKPSDKQQQSHFKSQPQGPRANSGQGQNTLKDGPIHVGVICDGCNGPVIGIRYKCCVCPNYNLCQSCKNKDLHAEHNMLRIIHPTFVPPPNPSFFFDNFIRGMASGAYGSASGTFTNSCKASASTSRGADFQNNTNNEDKKNENIKFQEYQNDFGANISTFIDPFGIKVSYSFHDGNGKQQQQNYHHNWKKGGGCPAWDDMCHGAYQNSASDSQQPGATEDVTEKMSTDSKNRNTDAPKEDVRKTEKESSASPDDWTYLKDDGSELRIPTSFAIPMPAPTSIPASVPNPDALPATGTASPPRPAAPPQPPTRSVPPPRPPIAPQFPAGPSPHSRPTTGPQPTSNDGSAPSEEIQDQHASLDLGIQQSLDQMLAMGFTDTDGWLTALLAEFEGDIGATLDAIKMKATQQLGNLHYI